MPFEEGHGFCDDAEALRAGASSDGPLPLELSFLPPGEIDRTTLSVAMTAARRTRTCVASVLIADGHLSAFRYYRSLSRHLDLEFIADWPEIVSEADVAAAHQRGYVQLADGSGRRLIAPCGDILRRLLSERRAGHGRADVALTTPAHLAALIHYRSQSTIEWSACEALPEAQPRLSARGALDARMVLLVGLATILFLSGLACMPRIVGIAVGLLFFLGLSFRLSVANAGRGPPDEAPPSLSEAELPIYTVLVPLRDEGDVLPDLLLALEAIDYPRAKLEVLVLIEPEDARTRAALVKARLPPWLHVVFGPQGGGLRTKPRALNIGLLMARGTLLTVFDAEDRPAPNQLRLAAARFEQLPSEVACLQARLAIDNGPGSQLARLFAVEYAFLFDIFNVGVGRLGLPMALGGTSNHFRTSVLHDIGGWDAWNVTEDADLGLRLARLGFRVGCLASTTLEVAPEQLGAWMKQRRRWLKGWMQTGLVLARNPVRLAGELGPVRFLALVFLLVNLVVGPLVFPLFSVYVTYRVARYGIPSPSGLFAVIEATVGTMVVVLGIVTTIGCGYVGMRARRLGAFLPSLVLMLPYQLLISLAAWRALFDLVCRPHHWDKTAHAARSKVPPET